MNIQSIRGYHNNYEGSVFVAKTDIGWKKPFYIEYDGSLVACRFVKWYPIINCGYAEMKFDIITANGMKSICHCKFTERQGSFYLDEFRAIDICRRFKVLGKDAKPLDIEVCCKKNYQWLGECIGKDNFTYLMYDTLTYCCRWYWDGLRVRQCNIYVNDLEYDYTNGIKFSNLSFYNLSGKAIHEKTYATKEDCEDNNSINIIDFDDDEADEEKELYAYFAVFVPLNEKDDFFKEINDGKKYNINFVEFVK